MGVEGSPEEQQRAWKPQWEWIVDGPMARGDGKYVLLPPEGGSRRGKSGDSSRGVESFPIRKSISITGGVAETEDAYGEGVFYFFYLAPVCIICLSGTKTGSPASGMSPKKPPPQARSLTAT